MGWGAWEMAINVPTKGGIASRFQHRVVDGVPMVPRFLRVG